MMQIFKYEYLNNQRGFSLIELSIVLGIIALLAGGVVVGSDMMNAAKLRDIPAQAYQYSTAISNFRDKYDAYPGDMATAESIWGTAPSATSFTATANGDGDGTIARGSSERPEMFRAWQHLKNAELIEGSYSGVEGSAGANHVVAGENAPEGPLKLSAYDVMYLETIPSGYFGNIYYRHVIHYGQQLATNNLAHAPILSALDAYDIDAKFDDRLPGSGTILTFNNTTHNDCASTDNATTAVYQRANAAVPDCTLIFITGF